MFPGARQRSIGPPTRPVHGVKSSSSRWLFAAGDVSAVTTAAAAIISITDHQPLGQLCCFLQTGSEWVSTDFTDGEEMIFNKLIEWPENVQEKVHGACVCFQVAGQTGLVDEAARVLGSLELSVNGGSCSSSDTNGVQLRIQKLQHTLTHMGVASEHC